VNITGNNLRRLHEISTADLLNAGIAGQSAIDPAVGWGPVVDGNVLPAHAFDPVASALAADVPLLVGNTFVEFGGGMGNPDAAALTFEDLRDQLQPTLAARTGDLIAAYRQTFPAARPFEIAGIVAGTQRYRLPAVTLADLKSAQPAPVYMYWFGWKTPVLEGRPLAYHCQDLAFWFDNIDLAAQATGGTDDARNLAAQMSAALVAFTRTGNPNHAGLPDWPAYSAQSRPTVLFQNESVTVQNDPDRAARELLTA
jgi:para-nitrobenzyl esterase